MLQQALMHGYGRCTMLHISLCVRACVCVGHGHGHRQQRNIISFQAADLLGTEPSPQGFQFRHPQHKRRSPQVESLRLTCYLAPCRAPELSLTSPGAVSVMAFSLCVVPHRHGICQMKCGLLAVTYINASLHFNFHCSNINMAQVLSFPDIKGCISVKRCHFLNSSDASNCSNTCLYQHGHFIHISDDYVSKISLS